MSERYDNDLFHIIVKVLIAVCSNSILTHFSRLRGPSTDIISLTRRLQIEGS